MEAVDIEGRFPPVDVVLGRLEAHNMAIRDFEGNRGEDKAIKDPAAAEKFSRPQRTDIAAYYRSQGAELS